MALSRSEITKLEEIVGASRLAAVEIVESGERTVIEGTKPAPPTVEPIVISAPVAGTVSFMDAQEGGFVSKGDVVASLTVLDQKTSVTAPACGRVAAHLAMDGALAGYGADLLLFEPEAD